MTTVSLTVVHTLALAFINFLWNYSDYSHAITAIDEAPQQLYPHNLTCLIY